MAARGGARKFPPTGRSAQVNLDGGCEEEEQEDDAAEEDTPCSGKNAARRHGRVSRPVAGQPSAKGSPRPQKRENGHDGWRHCGKGKYDRNGYDSCGTSQEMRRANGGYNRSYDRGYERAKGCYEDHGNGWGKGHANGLNGNSGFRVGSASISSKGAETMGTKLYVGNLPHDITRRSLEIVFSTYGRLDHIHIMYGRSKNGKSCAFVLYYDPQDAKSAIVAMQGGYEICPGEGDIIVKLADSSKHQGYERGSDTYEDNRKGWGKEAYENQRRGGGNIGSSFGAEGAVGGSMALEAAGTKLYVGNLPHDITRHALEMVFSAYGRLEHVHTMNGRSQSGKSCAFVVYLDPLDAKTAIAAMQTGYEIRPGEGNIIVKFADSSKGKKGKGSYENY